jgi:hypothetical protein
MLNINFNKKFLIIQFNHKIEQIEDFVKRDFGKKNRASPEGSGAPTGLNKIKKAHSVQAMGLLLFFGSPGRTRTADQVVNSHPLYRLSYRGIISNADFRLQNAELMKIQSL